MSRSGGASVAGAEKLGEGRCSDGVRAESSLRCVYSALCSGFGSRRTGLSGWSGGLQGLGSEEQLDCPITGQTDRLKSEPRRVSNYLSRGCTAARRLRRRA